MSQSRPEIPAREDYGGGCYRRGILLEADRGEVRGELADDFHHFAVRVRHDSECVEEIAGEGIRVPWTTCPGAIEPLRRMEGVALSRSLLELTRHTPARDQCTHWHDLACLAIAHAGRFASGGAQTRRYEVAMPDRVDRVTRCTLSRDGEALLEWGIHGLEISAAEDAAFVGLQIGGRAFRTLLAARTEEARGEPDVTAIHAARDEVEAAWLLQRAVFIGLGRQHDFDQMPTAEIFATVVGSSCHTYAPERVADGKRNYGTVRDFTDCPEDVFGSKPTRG